jgi:ABC-type antimicrobial peptide transport system permease subunit
MVLIANVFAAVTLLLAALGIYAVVAHAVNRELKHVGIRLMLGARPGRVLRLLIARETRPVLAGVVLGAIASVPAAFALQSQLFGVQPLDPLSLGIAIIILALVALLAALVPARVITRAQPGVLLRE